MKAMILAAGFGTRLQPLTEKLPKALIPFGNGTIISYQITKLRNAGITDIIINAHHLHNKIIDYFREKDFYINIEVIVEKKILGTGGGVINAKDYLKDENCFIVLNADVYTDFDIMLLEEHHKKNSDLATLAVQKRKSGRYLEFDSGMIFKGRKKADELSENLFAFNGIHVISSSIFDAVPKAEYMDILDLYTELIKKGFIIRGYDTGNCFFKDLGKPENLIP